MIDLTIPYYFPNIPPISPIPDVVRPVLPDIFDRL